MKSCTVKNCLGKANRIYYEGGPVCLPGLPESTLQPLKFHDQSSAWRFIRTLDIPIAQINRIIIERGNGMLMRRQGDAELVVGQLLYRKGINIHAI